MQGSIRSIYSNEVLNRIFCYFMRTVLHLQDSGIEKLPLENDFEEPESVKLIVFICQSTIRLAKSRKCTL
ncbi:hypothetical protein D7V90_23095, partial [bacterium 1xD42-87]